MTDEATEAMEFAAKCLEYHARQWSIKAGYTHAIEDQIRSEKAQEQADAVRAMTAARPEPSGEVARGRDAMISTLLLAGTDLTVDDVDALARAALTAAGTVSGEGK